VQANRKTTIPEKSTNGLERDTRRETRRGRNLRRRRRTSGFLFYVSLTELQEEKKSGGKQRKTQTQQQTQNSQFW
jgi:hypothetical protein